MPSQSYGPFVALYVKEVLGDTKIRALRDDQFGRLVQYWCLMADNGGTLPRDVSDFAAISRVDVRKVRADFQWLPKFFGVTEDGKSWRSDRLEKEAQKYAKKVDRARNNGRGSYPEIGAHNAPDFAPEMGPDEHPEMGGAGTTQNGGVTLTLKKIYPLTPASGGTAAAAGSNQPKAKRSRRPKAPEQPAGLSLETKPEIMALANEILDACPVKQPQGDRQGNRIRRDPGLVAVRLESILGSVQGVTPQILALAWKLYVESAPTTLKAPQYFFGLASDQGSQDAANWYPWAKLAYRK
ncbi:MAG TPA: hypothetical protein VN436_09920, partial [Holophaga sp.]|nr:hypothetical protein [Holophaga sp.]